MSATIGIDAAPRPGADAAPRPGALRVAIVGGGLAGIAAALDCARGGAAVTLLESRPRLGGAAYSFERQGLQLDNGQHVFLRCCTAYRGLLEQIDAAQAVSLQQRLEIPVLTPGRRPVSLRRSGLPAPLHLLGALARYSLLGPRDRFAVARAMSALSRIDPDDPAADARAFGDWLREHGQSPAAITLLWEMIARPTLNLDADDASLAQAAQVFQTGLTRDRCAGDIGWARVPLSQIHDVAAGRALARAGVDVRRRWRVSAIVPNRGSFQLEASREMSIAADAVIVAVPHDRVAGLLPAGAIDSRELAQLGRSPIVNLHILYDRRVLQQPFAVGVGTPVQWIFDRSASAGVDAGQYLAVSLSAADREQTMTIEELRQRYVPAVAALLPAARDARVESFFVTREHTATFRAAPGMRSRRPGARTGVPGLVLAGSWTDTGWPATMEGAVRSGHAAAVAALSRAPGGAHALSVAA